VFAGDRALMVLTSREMWKLSNGSSFRRSHLCL